MSDYQHAQHVFYYPEGERIEYATPDEGVAAYMQTHYRGAGLVTQQDAIGRAGYAHAVSFKAANGVEHGIYLELSGNGWVVAATSEIVPPDRLTPNTATHTMAESTATTLSPGQVDELAGRMYECVDIETAIESGQFKTVGEVLDAVKARSAAIDKTLREAGAFGGRRPY